MAMVHIIGAGVSGLAAATYLAEKNIPVRLYEATAHAGGRARTHRDPVLGAVDHGLHLFASSTHLNTYLKRIGSLEERIRVTSAFRPPRAALADYVEALGWLLGFTPLSAENTLRTDWLQRCARIGLSTELETLSPRIARQALLQALRHPTQFGTRYMARHSLSATFIAPALALLDHWGSSIYYQHTLTGLVQTQGRIRALQFARQRIAVEETDSIILALPPSAVAKLLPGFPAPTVYRAITLHYHIDHVLPQAVEAPVNAPIDLVRIEPQRISLSLRVAEAAWAQDAAFLASHWWQWLRRTYPVLPETVPPYAMIREPQAGHRLGPTLSLPVLPERLLLAGDGLQPENPATLEAAITAGHNAGQQAMVLFAGNMPHQHTPAHYQKPV